MKALLTALILTSCVDLNIYIDISDNAAVLLAKEYMKTRYPSCSFDQQIILTQDQEAIEQVCHQTNIYSCFYSKTIFIRRDIDPNLFCQALLHELNHSASLCIRGDWDLDHSFDPTFYTTELFLVCEQFPLDSLTPNLLSSNP